MFILKLPFATGFLIAMLTGVAFTSILFLVVHGFLRDKRSKTTRTFAQQMALRIGTLHALIIALVFGVIASAYMDLEKSLDVEATSIGSLYTALTAIPSDKNEKIRNQLILYLKNLIDTEWRQKTKRPLGKSTGRILFKIMQNMQNWQTTQLYEEKIKNYAMDLVLKINEQRIRRLYAWYREEIPPIFWVIAVAGFILTLVPYLTVELTKTRFFLINCYACMVGITFYGIILLNNPFMNGLVAPTPYEMIYNEMKEGF
ncbi:MAG: DUF4239 domain-containing protein [Desulfobacterales bacterium]|nr:MAG: DUF4239 domain-containing protein [Desulfobacterales bacterium]